MAHGAHEIEGRRGGAEGAGLEEDGLTICLFDHIFSEEHSDVVSSDANGRNL